MTELLRQFVRERARHCCEYCLLHQDDSPLAALHMEDGVELQSPGRYYDEP
jgi:hypothetical protein